MDVSLNDNILVDQDGASKLIGISAATLQKWRSTGENRLPYVKIGRSARYSTADLREYIDRHKRGG